MILFLKGTAARRRQTSEYLTKRALLRLSRVLYNKAGVGNVGPGVPYLTLPVALVILIIWLLLELNSTGQRHSRTDGA